MDNKKVFLNVSASDKNYTRYVSVIVNIINVNDEAPKFSNEIYNFSIAESNRTKLIVGQISATDKDGELNKLQYSLKDSGVFGIGGDGYITTTGVLDYESHNKYNLTATVNDSKHVDTANIVIYILPVNEYPPVFTKNYTWNVTENTKEVTQQIQATDMDKGDGKPITYRAHIPTKWAKNISFDNVSGNLTLKQIDREALGNNSVIRITAEALDGGTPQRTGLTIISIVVQGVNDESPVYPTEARNVTLRFKEGKKYPNMYTSKAFDADIGKGSIISYRLVKGNETFSIDEDSGIISTNDVLWINESNKGILKAEVEAFNAGSDKQDTQYITIVLQDINNNKPVFKQNRYTKKVDECSGPGTKILRVNATDADTTAQFNTVTYWLEEYKRTFYVDYSTGDLFMIGPLDCDSPQNITNYTFQIYATDDVKMENNSIFTTVEVTVSNCNDNAPVFTEDVYSCSLKESLTPIGRFNCCLKVANIEDIQIHMFRYSVKGGDPDS
ncbi:protocadherin Fat 2-like [Mercenaria mercenaria]|uniref:protocadherin Fat 2-like n=1 Tax=Mercenaria mercenaria TaxID=6596 RepID=UPI00234E5BC6|nr:protocadherin Fat 2-like [Mercenaria mercenaria]